MVWYGGAGGGGGGGGAICLLQTRAGGHMPITD